VWEVYCEEAGLLLGRGLAFGGREEVKAGFEGAQPDYEGGGREGAGKGDASGDRRPKK
jgi:hypothetical protein